MNNTYTNGQNYEKETNNNSIPSNEENNYLDFEDEDTSTYD